MYIKYEERTKAVKLRLQGWSVKDIAKKLKVSTSSISIWIKQVDLTDKQKDFLAEKAENARIKGLLMIKNRRENENLEILRKVRLQLEQVELTISICRILCAFLYWGEGSKTKNCVSFINSDPEMIGTFLFLLRKGFNLDERKFRCLVHLHNYHKDEEIKQYWSQITKIPLDKFSKSYVKPNTGKIVRAGYKGCLTINYYDSLIYKHLKVSYLEFFNQKVRGVG